MVESVPCLHLNVNYFREKRQNPTDYAYMDSNRPNLSTPQPQRDKKLALMNRVYNSQEHNDYFGGLRGTFFRALNPKCKDYSKCLTFTDATMALSALDMVFLEPLDKQLK